ncbi:MAG: hypothetical protein RMJ44_04655 [Cytophagales bacterium]|nr:hypothetical protein [Bernardetiaceae bacterium]MDW8210356.1 hypothetical protein [Cytophagales bacterium]
MLQLIGKFLVMLVCYYAGEFIIGGLLYALFGEIGSDPLAPKNAIFSWIGKIAGLLIAIWILF